MSLHDYQRIEASLGNVGDPLRLLTNLFAHAPVGLAVWHADGRPLLTNQAFRDMFVTEPQPESNVLGDERLAESGLRSPFQRAFAGEVVQVPTFWYAPPEPEPTHEAAKRRIAISMTIFPLFEPSGELEFVAATYKDETEIMLAEARARNSEDDLSIMLDSIGDGVIATDARGGVVRMNPVAESLTGWTAAEARGQRLEQVFRIFDELTRQPAPSPVARVLREEQAVGLTNYTLLVSREGAERLVSETAAPIRDAAGVVRGAVLVFHDQTRQRKAERAIERSEAHKAAVLQTALDAIVLTDDRGRISDFNPAAEKIFGYARQDAIGKQIADLLIPEPQRAAHQAGFHRYLETGRGLMLGRRVEVSALRADGSEFPAELAIVPTRVDGALSFTGYIRDISERVRAEQALKASEARFRHLADSGIIGIITAETSGKIVDANDAFLAMVGYSREELLAGSINWAEMTPPEWRALDEAAIRELARSGAAKAWEKEYIRKDGRRLPVVVGVALLESSVGVCFVLDLSARRRAEEASFRAQVVAQQETLGRELAEEALRKAEERLRQSQKMEAIGTLAGSIAHDFNNLLSVILGYVESLMGELRAGDPMRADIEEIGRAGKRAGELTRQLLAFSRRQILQPKLLDLNLAISGMARMLERIIGEDIELAFLPAPNLGAVYVDPGQIEQVLLNLVVNARDAMPQGGKLTIETGERELDAAYVAAEHAGVPPGRYVSLSVTDTGTGMDRATQARIFEPFFSTKEAGKGTGLGLSTVHGIVNQSGGHVWVYSEPGVGTTFQVYFPRCEGAPTPAAREVATASLRGTETILLVEDDEQVRHLAHTILARHGYRVLVAANPGDAVLICEQHAGPIHLLLSDVVMPRTSGRQLWERLAPLRPDLKVLFMSGYTDDAVVRHGVLTSELDFIQKPLSPAALLTKLRRVLEQPARTS